MNETHNVQKRFLDLADKEQSFRKQIVEDIGGLLRVTATPLELKVLIVMELVLVLFSSILLVICLVNGFLAMIPTLKIEFHGIFFGGGILGLALMGVLVGIPLVLRASSIEQALRLNDSFNKIYAAKSGR